jgi:hypothetical protein
MRVARDALAVEEPTWMLGDSVYNILDWYDPCGQQAVMPITSYNPRSTNESDTLSTGPKTT